MFKKEKPLIQHDKRLARDMAELAMLYFYNNEAAKKGKQAREFCAEFFETQIARVRKNGALEIMYKKGKLYAFFFVVKFLNGLTKENQTNVMFSYRPRSEEAMNWTRKMFKRHQHRFVKGTYLTMPVPFQKQQHNFVKRLGFNLDAVQLLGNTNEALKALNQKYNFKVMKQNLKDDHVTLEPLKLARDIGPMVAITKKTFTRFRHHCWFGNNQHFLKEQKKRFASYLRNKEWRQKRPTEPRVFVLKKDGIVRGHSSYAIRDEHPVWKRMAGIDFAYDPALIGNGYGVYTYMQFLQELKKKKVTYFQGTTANPAVLKLAKLMKRKPMQYSYRYKQGVYLDSHFKGFTRL